MKETPERTSALQRGLKILEILSDSREPQTLSSLARTLGLSVSSIQRMVDQLASEGYILRSATGGYYLSQKLYRVAHDHESERSLLQSAMPGMHDFVGATGESIHLSVAVMDQFVVIGQLSGTNIVRITVRPGSYPIDTLPSGLVLLVLGARGANNHLVDRINEDTRRFIRENEYWYGPSGVSAGIYHLSTPVLLKDGLCIAALTCSFALPLGEEDKPQHRVGQLVKPLKEAAREIQTAIG